jgi:hypothetical protein
MVLPQCIDYITSDDVNIRDFTLRILVTLQLTPPGRVYLRTYKSLIVSKLQAHSDSVAVVDKADQYETEHESVLELRSILSQYD